MRISKTTVMVKESDTLIDLRIKKSNYFFICESYCFLVEAELFSPEYIWTYISQICDMQEDVTIDTVWELPVVDRF